MKLFDLRLRGSAFTLGSVVNDNDYERFRELISYLQYTADNENAEVPIKFDLIPIEYFSLEKCEKISNWLLHEGYATKKGSEHTLTQKAFDVFEKTIEKDNELSASGFSCCPCHF